MCNSAQDIARYFKLPPREFGGPGARERVEAPFERSEQKISKIKKLILEKY